MNATFSLITLNCFGVPTTMTTRRLLTLARELNQRAADVVCLQEVQTHPYRTLLTSECTTYPSSAYAPYLHAPEGGLLTLAQAPFEETQFTLYRARDLWYTPAVADWLLHKGVLLSRLSVHGWPVIVLNTHLTANYSGDWSKINRYARNEWNQLQQLAEIVVAQPPEAIVLVAGDFNIPRGSWLYQSFLELSGLTDPLADDMQPTYRGRPGMPARYVQPIDFAFVRAPRLPTLRIHSALAFEKKVVFIDGRQGYLSDHLGVELNLSWQSSREC
jgi:endonuclease/exonuclease/phosphatase family metal-dependent hydrolase